MFRDKRVDMVSKSMLLMETLAMLVMIEEGETRNRILELVVGSQGSHFGLRLSSML